jgi:hypothetical protein
LASASEAAFLLVSEAVFPLVSEAALLLVSELGTRISVGLGSRISAGLVSRIAVGLGSRSSARPGSCVAVGLGSRISAGLGSRISVGLGRRILLVSEAGISAGLQGVAVSLASHFAPSPVFVFGAVGLPTNTALLADNQRSCGVHFLDTEPLYYREDAHPSSFGNSGLCILHFAASAFDSS